MKKVYSLIDKHCGYILATSKTRRNLEEMLCDEFMETFRQEMQEAVDSHWIDPINPTEDCRQYARDVWDSILRWFNSCYDIQRSNLI